MKKTALFIVAAAALGAASAASASTTIFYSGNSCNGSENAAVEHQVLHSNGFQNPNSPNGASAYAVCPAMGGTTDDAVQMDSANVFYYDWDGTTYVTCSIGSMNWDQSVVYSKAYYSGGLNNPAWTGYGTFSFSAADLGALTSLRYPINQFVSCSLGGNYSSISGYSLTVN